MRHRSHLADRWAQPFVMRCEKSILLTMNVLPSRSSDICRDEMKGKRKKHPEKGEAANATAPPPHVCVNLILSFKTELRGDPQIRLL